MKKVLANRQTAISACILCVIFILDIMFPPGIAIGIMYVLCFFSITRQSKTTILVFAACIIVVSLIKFVFFFPSSGTFILFINRGITITAIGVFAFVAYKRRKQFENFSKERDAYEKQLEEMLFMISHEVRKPITNCIGLIDHLESDKEYTLEELKEMAGHLKSSVYELETFTRKLTVFVDDVKQKEQFKDHDRQI